MADGIRVTDKPQAATAKHFLVIEEVGGVEQGPRRLPAGTAADLLAVFSNGVIGFALKAEMNAELDYDENTLAQVRGDSAANNGYYRKLGASGAGSWSKISDLDTAQMEADIAALEAALGDGSGGLVDVATELAAKVPATRAIATVGGLLTGAGNLTSNLTLTLERAGESDVLAGTRHDRSVTPFSLQIKVNAVEASRLAEEPGRRDRALNALTMRPGDVPEAFTTDLTGSLLASTGLSSGLVAIGDKGAEIVVTGAGVVATANRFPVEAGHKYRIRYKVERRADPVDPAGDAVVCRIFCLLAGKTALAAGDIQAAEPITDLKIESGQREVAVTVSTAAAADVDVVLPAGTIYVVPHVKTFGTTCRTAVQVIDWYDLQLATLFSPDLTSLTGRVDVLEGFNLNPRVTALETQITAPEVQLFKTHAAAELEIPAATTDIIVTRAWSADDDKGGDEYVKVVSEPSHQAKLQMADGSHWESLARVLTPAQVGVTGKNEITNPGGEDGTLAPHSAVNSGGIWSTIVSGQARSGNRVFGYDPAGQTAAATLHLNGDPASAAGHLACVAGDRVTAKGWVRHSGGATQNQVRIDLEFRDVAGVLLATFSPALFGTTDSYQAASIDGVAPADTAYAVGRAFVSSDGGDSLILWDDFELVLEADRAARAAYELGIPLMTTGSDAVLLVDPTAEAAEATDVARGTVFRDAIEWAGSCLPLDGKVIVRFKAGGHTINGQAELYPHHAHVYIEGDTDGGAQAWDERTIASINVGTRVGIIYEDCTIVLTADAPAYAVAGMPIGLQEPMGDNDAAAFAGAAIIKSVAGDTITFDWIATRTTNLVSPTTIDTSPSARDPEQSRVVFPKTWIICTGGFNGSVTFKEALINFNHGRSGQVRRIGLAWDQDSAETFSQSGIGQFHGNPNLDLADRVIIAGFPNKQVRAHAGHAWMSRCFLGGGRLGRDGVSSTMGSVQAARCSVGGLSDSGFVQQVGAGGNHGLNAIGSCSVGVLVVGGSASATTIGGTRIAGCIRGAQASKGWITVSAATELIGNSQAMDWLAGGYFEGPQPINTANVSDTPAPADTLFRGGSWRKTPTVNLKDPGRTFNISNGASITSSLSGTGGGLEFWCETIPQLGAVIDVDTVSPVVIGVARYAGPEIEFKSGVDPSGDTPTAGKVTIYVWNDAGTIKCRVRNEDGGTRRWRFYERGDLQASSFA
jgi:hypothetical protein